MRTFEYDPYSHVRLLERILANIKLALYRLLSSLTRPSAVRRHTRSVSSRYQIAEANKSPRFFGRFPLARGLSRVGHHVCLGLIQEDERT
jgi:hypothetical protein